MKCTTAKASSSDLLLLNILPLLHFSLTITYAKFNTNVMLSVTLKKLFLYLRVYKKRFRIGPLSGELTCN